MSEEASEFFEQVTAAIDAADVPDDIKSQASTWRPRRSKEDEDDEDQDEEDESSELIPRPNEKYSRLAANLYSDVAALVCHFLVPRQLLRLRLVNHHWRKVASSPDAWKGSQVILKLVLNEYSWAHRLGFCDCPEAILDGKHPECIYASEQPDKDAFIRLTAVSLPPEIPRYLPHAECFTLWITSPDQRCYADDLLALMAPMQRLKRLEIIDRCRYNSGWSEDSPCVSISSDLVALKQLPHLQALWIKAPITSNLSNNLSILPTLPLKALHMTICSSDTMEEWQQVVSAICTMGTLESLSLDLFRTPRDANHDASRTQSLPIADLCRLTNLKHLSLGTRNFNLDAITQWGHWPSLQLLDISESGDCNPMILKQLAQLASLQWLCVTVSDEGAEACYDLIAALPRLELLTLKTTTCRMEEEALDAISRLAASTTLQALSFGAVNEEDDTIDDYEEQDPVSFEDVMALMPLLKDQPNHAFPTLDPRFKQEFDVLRLLVGTATIPPEAHDLPHFFSKYRDVHISFWQLIKKLRSQFLVDHTRDMYPRLRHLARGCPMPKGLSSLYD